MFDSIMMLKQNDDFVIAIEAVAIDPNSDRYKKKHEFLVSRLERRWNYNKNSPKKARSLVKQYRTRLDKIKSSISGRKFNENKFSTQSVGDKRIIESKLMIAGLTSIPRLAAVFEEIASQPPSTESGNLPQFKALMRNSVKKNTPAYDYLSYQIYASFMVSKSFLKNGGRLTSAGYTENFINTIEKSLDSMETLIGDMEKQVGLIHKLSEDIVTALLSRDANKYRHARRQYELVNTVFRSILTIAPFQYISLALSIANSISECYN